MFLYFVHTVKLMSCQNTYFTLFKAAILINSLLVDKVYVHEDRIELILNHTGTPPKPKRRIDDKPESPEGKSLRGSLIFTTEASVEVYSYQGMKKNRPEPKFKGVCKKSVLIEI